MRKNPTKKVFESEVQKLREVEISLMREGKALTNKNLIVGLELKGLKVDRNKLYTLKQSLNKKNNFIVSISESQYSAMVQDVYDKIMYIEDKCTALAEEDWTTHTISTGNGDRNNFQKHERNQHKAKLDFCRIVLDCQNAKAKLLQGDVINVSVALIERNFDRLRDENAEYVREIQRLRKKLENTS